MPNPVAPLAPFGPLAPVAPVSPVAPTVPPTTLIVPEFTANPSPIITPPNVDVVASGKT